MNSLSQKLLPENFHENQTDNKPEEFVEKSGARGSFMVYRTTKKDDELGIDEL